MTQPWVNVNYTRLRSKLLSTPNSHEQSYFPIGIFCILGTLRKIKALLEHPVL